MSGSEPQGIPPAERGVPVGPVGVPRQVAHPARASVRTGAAAVFSAVLLLPLLLPVLSAWAQEYQSTLPQWLPAVIAGVGGVVAALAALVTRIMLIPGVNAWIERYVHPLAPTPRQD